MFPLLAAILIALAVSPADAALSSEPVTDAEQAAIAPIQRFFLETGGESTRPKPPEAPTKKDPARLGIVTDAKAMTVLDWRTGATLTEKNADQPLPLASITKLLAAEVITDTITDWDAEIEILPGDMQPAGGVSYIAAG